MSEPARLRTFSLAPLFLIFALLAVLTSVAVTVPYDVPDEPNHFMRAIQVSHGKAVGIRFGNSSGGNIPTSAIEHQLFFDPPKGRSTYHVTRAAMQQANAKSWISPDVLTSFPNTVTYGPAGYIPQATGILIGRTLNLSILQTFYLARLLNGLCYIALGTLAIALCKRGKLFLTLILLLPMSISLAASCSQDSLLIALSALLAAALSRLSLTETPRPTLFWITLGIGFGIVGMAKPPSLALSFAALFLASRPNLLRATLCPAIATVMTLAWIKFVAVPLKVPLKIQILGEIGVSDAEQAHNLLVHPTLLPCLIFHTLHAYGASYAEQFVGVLGWLDTNLPRWFIVTTGLLLVVTFLHGLTPAFSGKQTATGKIPETLIRKAGLFLLPCAAISGIFMSLYIIWTPVGAPLIDGIQGRYFLPIVMFFTLILPPAKPHPAGTKITHLNTLSLLGLTLWVTTSYIITNHTLITRYW